MYKEASVEFESDFTLKGTLTLPRQETNVQFPAVVFIHGSGPLNRDENTKKIQLNVFNRMAHWLAGQGLASLRYDKRGVEESEGNYYQAGVHDLIKDAYHAVEFIRHHPDIDQSNIFLIGHSEGGMLSPQIAHQTAVKGMILLASTASPLKYIIDEQGQRLEQELANEKGLIYRMLRFVGSHKKVLEKQDKLIRKALASEKDVIRAGGITKVNAKWFREHDTYHPGNALNLVSTPVLAINGSKDFQVRGEDVSGISEAAGGPAEVHVVNNMNHILRIQEEPESLLKLNKYYAKYSQQDIAQELYDVISPWLKKRLTE